MDDRVKEAAKRAAISGGVTGAVFGGLPPLLSAKPKSWRRYLLESLTGAALGGAAAGGMAGGSTLLGSALLGAPKPSDSSAYTRRAAVGGAIGGGLGGALLGAGAAKLGKLPSGTPHLLKEGIVALSKTRRPALIASILGGGLGAVAAGAQGADEGMQLDFINNELRRQKMLELLG